MKKSVIWLAAAAIAVLSAPTVASATLLEFTGATGSPLLALTGSGLAGVASLSGGEVLAASTPTAALPTNTAPPIATVGNFLAAGPADGGNDATLLFTTPTSELSFLWGSPDTFNTLSIVTNNEGTLTFTASSAGVTPPNGDQQFAEYVDFVGTAGTMIESITFESTSNAFEVSNFAVSGVPEASTWAMMALGFLGLGFLGYRKSSGTSFRVA